jgi:hypothetical protein
MLIMIIGLNWNYQTHHPIEPVKVDIATSRATHTNQTPSQAGDEHDVFDLPNGLCCHVYAYVYKHSSL